MIVVIVVIVVILVIVVNVEIVVIVGVVVVVVLVVIEAIEVILDIVFIVVIVVIWTKSKRIATFFRESFPNAEIKSLPHWLTDLMTRSPIELSWTTNKGLLLQLCPTWI